MEKQTAIDALEGIGFVKIEGQERWKFTLSSDITLSSAQLAEIATETELKIKMAATLGNILNALRAAAQVTLKQLDGLLPNQIEIVKP